MRRIKITPALQDRIEKALHTRDLSLSSLDDRAAQKGLNRPNSKTVGRWISGEVESINEGSLTDFAKILDVPYLELRQELGLLSNGEATSLEDADAPTVNVGRRVALTRRPLLALASILLGFVLLALFWTTSTSDRVSHLELSQDEEHVLLIGVDGAPVRTIDVGGEVIRPMLVEIDGEQYVIVGVREQSNESKRSGLVIGYNINGDSLWSFNMFDREFINDKSGFYIVNGLGKARFFGEQKEYIVAMAREPLGATTRVAILDLATGEDVYSFWNDGRINNGEQVRGILLDDFNADGSSEILLAAAQNTLGAEISRQVSLPNEGFYFRSALLLEPQKHGRFCGPGLRLPECPRQTIKWMVLGHPFNDALTIEMKNIDNTSAMAAAIGMGQWGSIYYLDYEGNIVRTDVGGILERQGFTKVPPLLALKMTEAGVTAHLLHSDKTDEAVLDSLYNEDEMRVIRQFLKYEESDN